MEFFKFFLFGIAGLSMIFWVAVIALWHTYMFPRFFKEDQIVQINKSIDNFGFTLNQSGLADRSKYSRKALVVADFNPIESSYGVNRLYTSMLISLGIMSFLLTIYGLHSGLIQFVSL